MPVPMIAILTKQKFGRDAPADQSMARANHAPKSAEPAASAVGGDAPVARDVVAGGQREDAVDGVGEDAARQPSGRVAVARRRQDEAGADDQVARPQRAREHGRRRVVGADPAARDRSGRRQQRDADERAARTEADREGREPHRATLTSASTVQTP